MRCSLQSSSNLKQSSSVANWHSTPPMWRQRSVHSFATARCYSHRSYISRAVLWCLCALVFLQIDAATASLAGDVAPQFVTAINRVFSDVAGDREPDAPKPVLLHVGCGDGALVRHLVESDGPFDAYGVEDANGGPLLPTGGRWRRRFVVHDYVAADVVYEGGEGDATLPVVDRDMWDGSGEEQWETMTSVPSPDVLVSIDDAHFSPGKDAAAAFAATIASAGAEVVFFVAASPGEGLVRGEMEPFQHEVGSRWWAMAFEQHGYEIDLALTVQLRNGMIANVAPYADVWWVPKNIIVLLRNPGFPDSSTALRAAAGFLGYGARPAGGVYRGPGATSPSRSRATSKEWAWRLQRDDRLLRLDTQSVQWFDLQDATDARLHALLSDDALAYSIMISEAAKAVQGPGALEEKSLDKYDVEDPVGVQAATSSQESDTHVVSISEKSHILPPDAPPNPGNVVSGKHPADLLTFTSSAEDALYGADIEAESVRLDLLRKNVSIQQHEQNQAGMAATVSAAHTVDLPTTAAELLKLADERLPRSANAGLPFTERTFDDIVQMYYAGESHRDRLHEVLVLYLDVIAAEQPRDQGVLDRFLTSFLFVLSRPDFNIQRTDMAQTYLRHVHLVASIVRWSDIKSTDSCLRQLSNNQRGLVQMLLLYSPFNSLSVSAEQMWPHHQLLADYWLQRVMMLLFDGSMANSMFYHNVRGLIESMIQVYTPANHDYATEPMLPALAPVRPWWQSYELYFSVSYMLPQVEARVKSAINTHFRSLVPRTGVAPQAVPARRSYTGNRVVVISAQWKHGHSVHRNFRPYVRELQKEFELTLVFLESDQIGVNKLDRSGFANVIVLPKDFGDAEAAELARQLKRDAYDAIFYPEIGMHFLDIYLANQRLAPVQITSYGHSTSTHGALIDYFIGSAEVELAGSKQHYSERLVLLPGLGIIFEQPKISPPPTPHPVAPIVLNCAWTMIKLNYEHMSTLAAIVRESQRLTNTPLVFRFFTAVSATYGNLALQDDLEAALDVQHFPAVSVDVVPVLPYESYMSKVELGHIALDSFHWGGCNSLVDQLVAGVPIVVREGQVWRNRIGPAMLRRLGLPELVAATEQEFVSISTRLIVDQAFRDALRSRVRKTDLSPICDVNEARWFREAFRKLIGRHGDADMMNLPALQPQNSSEPLVFGAR